MPIYGLLQRPVIFFRRENSRKHPCKHTLWLLSSCRTFTPAIVAACNSVNAYCDYSHILLTCLSEAKYGQSNRCWLLHLKARLGRSCHSRKGGKNPMMSHSGGSVWHFRSFPFKNRSETAAFMPFSFTSVHHRSKVLWTYVQAPLGCTSLPPDAVRP